MWTPMDYNRTLSQTKDNDIKEPEKVKFRLFLVHSTLGIFAIGLRLETQIIN